MTFFKSFLKKDVRQIEVPDELKRLGISMEALKKLQIRAISENNFGPKIALIGETGVGKSSTINALFNAGQEISHVRPCTKEPTEIEYIVEGSKGNIRIVDMPGLGESIKNDEEHYKKYIEKLPECDVIVWLFQADVRAMTTPQIYLKRLINDQVIDPKRLVIAINKVDIIQPGIWITDANLPSSEQEQSINDYEKYVVEALEEINLKLENCVVSFSAKKHYDLHKLFQTMLRACPHERLWFLFERRDLADFCDLVDPDLLKSIQDHAK